MRMPGSIIALQHKKAPLVPAIMPPQYAATLNKGPGSMLVTPNLCVCVSYQKKHIYGHFTSCVKGDLKRGVNLKGGVVQKKRKKSICDDAPKKELARGQEA